MFPRIPVSHRLTVALSLALAFAPVGLGCRTAPLAPADPRADTLRAKCTAFAEKHGAVGMGVAVLDDGRVVLDTAIGFADREAARAAQTSTLYRLGSISKPVCAAIAMQLVEEGDLELDAPIADRVLDLPRALRPLTLRQLLSHTSGVRHYRSDRADNGTAQRSTREALQLFLEDPLLFEPGAKYSYSTHAYTLVVAAVEAATKRDYVGVLRERMHRFAPTLDCEVSSDVKPQRSALYDRLDSGASALRPVREDNSWKYGGGGLESTALDLARFGQAVLECRLVREESRSAMWRPTELSDGSKSGYGLGWRLAPDGSAVFHSGSQQGCHAMLLIVPEEGLVIAVMSNTQASRAPELAHELRKLLETAQVAVEAAHTVER